MVSERDLLLGMGMPETVAQKEAMFNPSSVGVIMHTGDFDFEERRNNRSGEPSVLVVRQADQIVNGYHPWGITAGGSNPGESIIQTALREIPEETGINIDAKRLRWFCPVGERKVVLHYQITTDEIPRWEEAEEHEHKIMVFPPDESVDTSEVDRLALVPVEIFFDHMMVGRNSYYRKISLLHEYVYSPKSREVDENVDFVPAVYRSEIWQAIRHQMFVRKILPPYLG